MKTSWYSRKTFPRRSVRKRGGFKKMWGEEVRDEYGGGIRKPFAEAP